MEEEFILLNYAIKVLPKKNYSTHDNNVFFANTMQAIKVPISSQLDLCVKL